MRFVDLTSSKNYASQFVDQNEIEQPADPLATAADAAEILSGDDWGCDRHTKRTWLFIIIAMLDLVCIACLFPIIDQLCAWANASVLNCVYIGFSGLALGLPLIISAALLIWPKHNSRKT